MHFHNSTQYQISRKFDQWGTRCYVRTDGNDAAIRLFRENANATKYELSAMGYQVVMV